MGNSNQKSDDYVEWEPEPWEQSKTWTHHYNSSESTTQRRESRLVHNDNMGTPHGFKAVFTKVESNSGELLEPVAQVSFMTKPTQIASDPERYLCLDCGEKPTSSAKSPCTEVFPESDFCLICGHFFVEDTSYHGSSLHHRIKKANLLKRMYPYPCHLCPLRFLCIHELRKHDVACFSAHESVGFRPICCYLCILPFRSRSQWERHMLSVEHVQREELAKEISRREQFAPKAVMFSDASTQTLPTVEDISLKNVSNGTYFCCPCSADVPKANVIAHEQGAKHKKSCETWVSNMSKKSWECHKKKISVGAKINQEESKVEMVADTNSTAVASKMGRYLPPEENIKCGPTTHLSMMQNFPKVHPTNIVSEHLKGNCEIATHHEVETPLENFKDLSVNGDLKISSNVHSSRDSKILVLSDSSNSVYSDPSIIKVQKVITKQDVMEAITEYFHIDQIIPTKKNFKCTQCLVSGIIQNMIQHVLSKKHKTLIMPNQSVTDLERKLEILSFLQLSRDNDKLLKCMSFIEVEKTLQEIKCLVSSLCQRRTSLAIEINAPLAIAQNTNSSVESFKNTEKSDNAEKCSLGDTIVIGNSNLVSLQEEIEQACQGQEIEDFEYECEICGVVITIFNGDLELSMDMHIQNDAQHQFATAVPVERDAQKMAEMSKTVSPQGKASQVKKFASAVSVERYAQNMTELSRTVSPQFKSVQAVKLNKTSGAVKDKATVLNVILKLEEGFLDLTTDSIFCKLCASSKRRSVAVHHLLSKQHMSDQWAQHFSDFELHEKCKVLSSLQNCNFGIGMLHGAILRIREILDNRSQQSNNSSSSRDQKELVKTLNSSNAGLAKTAQAHQSNAVSKSTVTNSTKVQQNKETKSIEIFCEICSLNITSLTKKKKKKHREDCKNVKTQNKGSSQSANVQKANTAKPVEKLYYCDICKRSMAYHSKKPHISGKSHKSKLSEIVETALKLL